jgi:hypothetical protein
LRDRGAEITLTRVAGDHNLSDEDVTAGTAWFA